MKPNLKHRATVFSLGNRDCVLKQELEAPIIVPHAQQKAETKVNKQKNFSIIRIEMFSFSIHMNIYFVVNNLHY